MKLNLTCKNIIKLTCLMVGLISSSFTYATLITAEITNSTLPNYYELQYSIVNNGPTEPIDGIVFYFDYGLFQNISLVNSPLNWDFFSADPELIFGVEESGLVDGLALFDPLTVGQELNSLIISFEWLGSNDLLSYVQLFEIYNADTFDFISDGTVALSAKQVPEPSTLVIFVLALMLLMSSALTRRQGE